MEKRNRKKWSRMARSIVVLEKINDITIAKQKIVIKIKRVRHYYRKECNNV